MKKLFFILKESTGLKIVKNFIKKIKISYVVSTEKKYEKIVKNL